MRWTCPCGTIRILGRATSPDFRFSSQFSLSCQHPLPLHYQSFISVCEDLQIFDGSRATNVEAGSSDQVSIKLMRRCQKNTVGVVSLRRCSCRKGQRGSLAQEFVLL